MKTKPTERPWLKRGEMTIEEACHWLGIDNPENRTWDGRGVRGGPHRQPPSVSGNQPPLLERHGLSGIESGLCANCRTDGTQLINTGGGNSASHIQ